MSRCLHLALVLSVASACEHANESTTPSVVMPAAEPTTTSSSSTQPDAPPPAPKPVARPAAAPVAKPEPEELECKQVGSFQTRAGPRWVCVDKEPARVRVVKESK